MYKSTCDSNNLGSLGCVILTIALQQQLLFCALCFVKTCLVLVLSHQHFMWARLANCVSCPNGSLLYWNYPDTVEFWDNVSASDVWIVLFLDFSIYLCWLTFVYLQDIYHGLMCKPDFLLLGKDHPNLIKVVIQAGPWSVWLKYISSKFIHLNFLAVIDFTFENTICHHFWIWVDVTNSILSNAMVSGLSVSSLMTLRLIQVSFAVAETFWCLQYCTECFWLEQLCN